MSITTRTLLLMLILTATSSAQQFRVNVQPQFRVIVQRPSAAVVDVSRTQHTETTPAADISELLKMREGVIDLVGTKETEFTIVICGAEWCGPCRNYKKSSEYRRILTRYQVELADIDKFPAWRPYAGQIPKVWVIRTADRQRLRSFQGAATLKQIDDMIEDIRNPRPKVNNGVTQRGLIRMHDRIHNQASGLNTTWTWSGNLREHLRSVHGVAL